MGGFLLYLLFLFGSLVMAGCGGGDPCPRGCKEIGDAGGVAEGKGETVAFASVMMLLRARCSPCHTTEGLGVFPIGTSSADDVSAYAQLVGPARGSLCIDQGWPRVQPREPERSLVYLKVQARVDGTDPPCGGPMPVTQAPPLPAAEIDVIRRWIAAGAPG